MIFDNGELTKVWTGLGCADGMMDHGFKSERFGLGQHRQHAAI